MKVKARSGSGYLYQTATLVRAEHGSALGIWAREIDPSSSVSVKKPTYFVWGSTLATYALCKEVMWRNQQCPCIGFEVLRSIDVIRYLIM